MTPPGFKDDDGFSPWSGAGSSSGIDGDGGKFRRFASRLFENPDNPLGWSVKLFTVSRIAVRLHLLTILFVGFQLVRPILRAEQGFVFAALAMGSLLVIVLLHEFGHCFACRWIGGEADRIVMLPFGGLALIHPPHTWLGHFVSTAGGPMVNIAILPLTCAGLALVGLGEFILFNPLQPGDTLNLILADLGSSSSGSMMTMSLVGLWYFHFINIVILCFNLLVPSYPLDGGRIVQSLLWRRMGYTRATEIAVTVGYVGAFLMILLGITAESTLLAVIGGFCLWACWTERRRIRGEEELVAGVSGVGGAVDLESADTDRWTERAEAKREAAEHAEQAELDRILAKIADSGMESLSKTEKRTLESATKRRRKQ